VNGITTREDADQPAIVLRNQNGADSVVAHRPASLFDRGLRREHYRLSISHDVRHFSHHRRLSAIGEFRRFHAQWVIPILLFNCFDIDLPGVNFPIVDAFQLGKPLFGQLDCSISTGR
jgi:hypothetical protein